MIQSIEIEALRGIPHVSLAGLGKLVVLVGPNGCGKSTVLDAMLIGASGSPGDAVGRAVQRRVELWDGARWLFPKGGRADTTPRITVEIEGQEARTTRLKLFSDVSPENKKTLVERQKPGPYVEIGTTVESSGKELGALTAFSPEDNFYTFTQDGARSLRTPKIRFIEPRPGARHELLARVFSKAVEAGEEDELNALIADVVPESPRLMLLTDEMNAGVLHVTYRDRSIPVAISGDGVLTLVRLACELSLPSGSTAVIEEPEAHQHPRAERQSARAIAAAVRRGVQVVLSTHSLELIDDLINALGEADLPQLTVFGMAQRKGSVVSVRYEGRDVAFAREHMGEDLR